MERRREEEKKNAKPIPLNDIDWNPILKYVKAEIDHINAFGYGTKDFKYYLRDKVFTSIYGPDIWKWLNSNSND